MTRALIAASLASIALFTGCSYGKKNILFSTKSSLGIDIDTKAPTFDVGFARKEGTVSPRYESGDALPQMASFSTDVGFMKAAVSQSFAVGDAAYIMSKYIGTKANLNVGTTISEADLKKDLSTVTGSNPKPYFFYTDTAFALKINFGVETGTPVPDAFHLGWKRKELAFVPIAQTVTTKDGVETTHNRVPALVATADLDTASESLRKTDLKYRQFFATGMSAKYLAANSQVRNALGMKIIQDTEIQQALALDAMKESIVNDEKVILDFVAPNGAMADPANFEIAAANTAGAGQAASYPTADALRRYLKDSPWVVNGMADNIKIYRATKFIAPDGNVVRANFDIAAAGTSLAGKAGDFSNAAAIKAKLNSARELINPFLQNITNHKP